MEDFNKDVDYTAKDEETLRRNYKAYLKALSLEELFTMAARLFDTSSKDITFDKTEEAKIRLTKWTVNNGLVELLTNIYFRKDEDLE